MEIRTQPSDNLKDLELYLAGLGFRLNPNASGKSVHTLIHSNPALSVMIKREVKARGFVNIDFDRSGKPRKYGPVGNQHENFDHSNGEWVQVAKYRDGRGGGSRGTSVSLHLGFVKGGR